MKFYADDMHSGRVYERQDYLYGCLPPRLRAALAKFRLRSHDLGIIENRWQVTRVAAKCQRCEMAEIDEPGTHAA